MEKHGQRTTKCILLLCRAMVERDLSLWPLGIYSNRDLFGLNPYMAKQAEWDYKGLWLGSGGPKCGPLLLSDPGLPSLLCWPRVYLAKDRSSESLQDQKSELFWAERALQEDEVGTRLVLSAIKMLKPSILERSHCPEPSKYLLTILACPQIPIPPSTAGSLQAPSWSYG